MDIARVLSQRPLRFRFHLALYTLLAATLWAQAPGGGVATPQDQAPAGGGARATRATPEKTISPEEAKELFKSVEEILEFASQETKLPIKEGIKRRLVERNEVQAYVEKSMKEDKDTQRLARSEVVLKKFGLLPRNFDLQTFLVALLKEQVAGYYDPKTKTVNLLNWVDAKSQRPVLAHELTHALQDESFGLEKWMRAGADDSGHAGEPSPDDIVTDEVQTARQAVVEGQAMVTLLDYSLAPTGKTLLDVPQIAEALKQGMLVGTADTPTFHSAPIFLKDTLTFPYRYGLDFTAALLSSGGKELAFGGALKNPPRTTREIMEPQTYLAHEKLEPIKMLDFDRDFKGYERFDIGAMGEFDVAVLIEQYAGGDEARALYPDWRGGYYFAGRPRGDKSAPLGLLYVSRWSTPAKAAEFAAVYAKSLVLRYQRPRGLGADGKVSDDAPPADSWRTLRGHHAWLTEDGPVVIEVRGDAVLISESLDEDTTKRATADFWTASQ
ncbi:MAG TPA: hypothetical protein VNW47_02345 [Terriglobales bacterium]|jgi:hypothetical protein|nr:hypothetical protein [Terriglobales bacterium]